MSENLLEMLKQYGRSDFYPLHMPGHKRQVSLFEQPFSIDITEIDGFDDLHHAQGILRDAQRRAARLFGAEETCYLVNGSTCGILAAVAAAVPGGGRILMARNSHKSVYNAVFLNGLHASYLYPKMDPLRGIAGSIRPEDVRSALWGQSGAEQDALPGQPGAAGSISPGYSEDMGDALREYPVWTGTASGRAGTESGMGRKSQGIQAVLITSPTYDGVVSDIRAIAEEAHRAGALLIVDEAHGAHFGMHSCFPDTALSCGADLVVNSLHKTLPSLTQTALLHVQGGRADREKLRSYLGIYQSSSPSYVLMAGMDACIDLLERKGSVLFDEFVRRLEKMRSTLRQMRVLHLVDGCEQELSAFAFDRSRILISLERCAMTGPELALLLREKYHLEPEMSAENYVTAILTVADTEEGFARLTEALLEIDAWLQTEPRTAHKPGREMQGQWRKNEEAMSIREAQEHRSEAVLLRDSAGRVSAGYVYLYPPGIPLLVPGERISEGLLQEFFRCRAAGLVLRGLSGSAGASVRVVKER